MVFFKVNKYALVFLLFSLVLCVFNSSVASAQKYFVYVQSEQKQQFQLRIGERTVHSNPNGYAIIGEVEGGAHNFIISFPSGSYDNQSIPVEITGDAGFNLKYFENKGWGLFDLQKFSVLMNEAYLLQQPQSTSLQNKITADSILHNSAQAVIPVNNELLDTVPNAVSLTMRFPVDTILATTIVNDGQTNPTGIDSIQKLLTDTIVADIKSDTLAPPKPPMPDPTGISMLQDSAIPSSAMNATSLSIADTTKKIMHSVVLINEAKDIDGRAFVYEVKHQAEKDTVQIFLPRAATKLETTDTITYNNNDHQLSGTRFNETASVPAVTTPAVVDSLCNILADDADFLALRKAIVAQENTDAMLVAAEHSFKQKCFTTGHLKNLGAIFLNDLDKLRFYQLAYKYTADKANFDRLSATLDRPQAFSIIIKE